jgi:hypothetical protein
MKDKKHLEIGDKVIFKPHRYSIEKQPWIITEVLKATDGVVVYYRISWASHKRQVKPASPVYVPVDPGQDLQPAFDELEAKLTRCDKTWENLQIGEYYQRYAPCYGGDNGFVYYKITAKREPTEDNKYYRIEYRVFHGKNNAAGPGRRSATGPRDRIFGRNFKHISKLEGMMKVGE